MAYTIQIKRIVWKNGNGEPLEEMVGESMFPTSPKVQSIIEVEPKGIVTPGYHQIQYENGDIKSVYNIVEVYRVPIR